MRCETISWNRKLQSWIKKQKCHFNLHNKYIKLSKQLCYELLKSNSGISLSKCHKSLLFQLLKIMFNCHFYIYYYFEFFFFFNGGWHPFYWCITALITFELLLQKVFSFCLFLLWLSNIYIYKYNFYFLFQIKDG